MQISKRLRAVADLVTPGNRVADIGTDHAYVPILLMKEGKIPGALAMDIGEGPLKRAAEHIREQGLEDRIQTRLSDGLTAYQPGEADSIVVAGMGGALIEHILTEGMEKCKDVKELILSPQSELFLVRRWLWSHGWKIERETMLVEEGKYYTIMRAVPGEQAAGRTEELYGTYLLETENPVLLEFLQKEKRTLQSILAGLEAERGEHIEIRKKELREKLLLAEEALAYYEMQ